MVDFSLPEEVIDLQKLAREFATKEIRPAEAKLDAMGNPEEAFRSDVYRSVVKSIHEIGFHKATVPGEAGGLGLSGVASCVIEEELAFGGAGLASRALIAPIGASVIAGSGIASKHPFYKEYVEAFVEDTEGIHSGCWAITEPGRGSDFLKVDGETTFGTTATRDAISGKWTINGAKAAWVTNGWEADIILLMATARPEMGMEGTAVFLLPGDLPGISRGKPLNKLGMRALNQAEIFFDEVEVPEEFLLFDAGPAYPMLLEMIVTAGNTAVATLAVGVTRAAYETALQYSKERVQGGKPIFEHQLIAMKLFDAFRDIEAARALIWKSAWLMETNRPDLRVAFAARSMACNMALKVTAEMVQILGGYGISKEHPVEKFYRDVKLLQIMDGTLERISLTAAARL